MALINCPECGREISDKATACIHCGFPLSKRDEINCDKFKLARKVILARVEPICTELDKYKGYVQPQIRDSVVETEIKNLYDQAIGSPDNLVQETDDKVAEIIVELMGKLLVHSKSKPLVYSYYSLIHFDNISQDKMKMIADKIYQEILPHDPPQYWNDGSQKRNSNYIIYSYPLSQILIYADDNIKKPIIDVLSVEKYLSKISALDFVYNEGKANKTWTPSNTTPPIKAEDSSVVRCPKCNSTQITTGSRGYSIVWGLLGSSKTVNRCARCGHKWEPKR